MDSEYFEWLTMRLKIAPVSENHFGDCGFIINIEFDSPKNGLQKWGRAHAKDETDIQNRVTDALKRALQKDEFNKAK